MLNATPQMYFSKVCALVLLAFLAVGARAIAPIWLSPTDPTSNIPYVDAVKFEWTNITVGASSRGFAPIIEVDSKGLVWILGGQNDYYINAVWNYDPKTDLYRWVAGTMDYSSLISATGPYGVQDPNAFPTSLKWSASAIDRNDNIWIYGSDDDPTNLFWMFNTTSFQFTYLTFNDSILLPVSVGKGIASADNYPGGIDGGRLVVDSKGDLWLLGGYYSSKYRNSVWHYNTTSMMWTWMWGELDPPGPANFTANYWNGRWTPGVDIDRDDRIWVFGGQSKQPPVNTYNSVAPWSDLWSFDTKTLEWRVEWGNESFFHNEALITVPDEFNIGNYPGARDSTFLIDRKDGTLLIGPGNDFSRNSRTYNDLWLFNTTSKLWKHVYGDPKGAVVANEYTHYRAEGSVFGTRSFSAGAVGMHNNGNFLVFGGKNGNFFSDLWLFPQDTCAPGVHNCDPNASCQRVDYFSFNCTCNEGYLGDGKVCNLPSPPTSAENPSAGPVSSPSNIPKGKTSNGAINLVAGTTFLSVLSLLV